MRDNIRAVKAKPIFGRLFRGRHSSVFPWPWPSFAIFALLFH